MNFFARHRKVLMMYGTAPLIALAFMIGCFIFFRPPGMPVFSYLDYLFSGPLALGLEMAATLAMLAYLLHHRLKPVSPRHRGYFVAAAMAAGVVIDALYNQRLSETVYFMSFSGMTQFIAVSVVFYCIYRLVILMPDRERRMATIFLAAALLLHILFIVYALQNRIQRGFPCSAEVPDLWQAVLYRDPQHNCAE